MELKDLKLKIEEKTLNNKMLIFKCSDINNFLIKHYLEAISNLNHKELKYIDKIEDLPSYNPLFNISDNNIYVCTIDSLTTNINDNNIIIVCKEMDENLRLALYDYIVEIPEIQKWQIEEYVKTNLPGLDNKIIKWLCEQTNYDSYRLENEIKKLKIFDKSSQLNLFNELNEENGYQDLNKNTIFNLSTAILKKETDKIEDLLMEYKNGNLEIDPMALISILYKNLRAIIDIQLNPSTTAEAIGMNYKQFYAIKNNCGRYSDDKLIKIFQLITSLDFKIKTNWLPYDKVLDYIIINILEGEI